MDLRIVNTCNNNCLYCLEQVYRNREKFIDKNIIFREILNSKNKEILNYCENRQSFIVNNTHLKLKYRKQLIDSISKYNPKIIIVYVEAETLDLNLSRRTGPHWEYVIKEMLASMEMPSENEANELIIITT